MRKFAVISLTVIFCTALTLILTVYIITKNGFSPIYDKLLSQHPLTNQSCILVYMNSGGGAMTGYSHAFFMASSCEKEIEDMKPFLNTDDVKYSISIDKDKINILIYGDIYNVNENRLEEYKKYKGDITILENNTI